ncbi:hypothetical protein RFI_12358, partial [Reticulomyxa filosa]
LLQQTGCSSWNDCVLMWKVYDQNQYVSENWMFISSPKNIVANDPQFQFTDVQLVTDNEFQITFTSKATAAFVWLETEVDGFFENNGFLMTAGEKSILFYSQQTTTLSQLTQSLKVYSLYEMGGFQNQPWKN